MTGKAENTPTVRLHGCDLKLHYDERTISQGLSASIADGSFTVIAGPNACGKSTLLPPALSSSTARPSASKRCRPPIRSAAAERDRRKAGGVEMLRRLALPHPFKSTRRTFRYKSTVNIPLASPALVAKEKWVAEFYFADLVYSGRPPSL